MRALILLFFLILCTASGAPIPASAQLGNSADVSLLILPEYPRPYDVITITPQSSLLNLGSSRVTISLNGAVLEEGSGARSTSMVLGGPGSRSVIRATVVSGGVTYTTETTIRPTDVSLVLEPMSTSHPLYKVSPLVAPQGPVRIVALPDFRNSSGARISAGTLSYTWRLGNRILTEESGIGRSVLSATAPVRYRNADVSVTVSTTDDSMTGYAEVEVSPAAPAVYVYRSDPLLGIDLSRAISDSFLLETEEETFKAVPFGFANRPSFTWTLGNEPASSDTSLTVRTTSSGNGKTNLKVTGASVTDEQASAGFELSYTASRSSGIFGF